MKAISKHLNIALIFNYYILNFPKRFTEKLEYNRIINIIGFKKESINNTKYYSL